MEKLETLHDFYKNVLSLQMDVPEVVNAGHFNVFPRRYCLPSGAIHRRDFFKISLMTKGEGIFHFPDRDVFVDRPGLFFSNPQVAYSWEPTTEQQEGWFCLFTEEFIQSWDHAFSVKDYPMFRVGENPLVPLEEEALGDVVYIFRKMIQEINSDYVYKFSKIRNYLQLLVHEALKYYPDLDLKRQQTDAAHRIAFRFLDLLEQQFPVENPQIPIRLRGVQSFADSLSVHENHLNTVVKEVTGRSPSHHIALRLAEEAKALLKNTDWSIAEIAESLRFEYSSHFTSFFKKNTGFSPREFRSKIL